MTAPTTVNSNVRINGTLSVATLQIPEGTIRNADVAAFAGVEASKLEHQHALHYDQAAGGDVASQTRAIHVFRAAGEIIAVDVVPIVAPTGGDKAFDVDLQLGNAGGAFASILTAAVTVDSSSADRTVQAGTIDSEDAVAGDTLQIVVTASGSTGSQGQGVIVTVTVREAAQ